MGNLYLVERVTCADDLSLRATRILTTASVIITGNIAAARALLDECAIKTPLIDLPDVYKICELLANGDVAWLDRTFDRPPMLIAEMTARGIDPLPLPGGVDAITALVLSGLSVDRFAFYSSLPADLAPCAREPYTLLFEIEPTGWSTALKSLLATLGDRRAALYNPTLTWRGYLSQAPHTLIGATILVIEGTKETTAWDEATVREAVQQALAAGASPRDAAQMVAGQSGWPRRQVYALAVKLCSDR